MIIADCRERITDIEKVLRENDHLYESMGMSNGLLGMSLFNYYSYLYTGNEVYLNEMSNYITKAFNGFDETYKGFSGVHDIIEIGNYLYFLKEADILSEDPNEYLTGADEVVNEFLQEQLIKKNIDPVSGCIEAGYYLLNRLDNRNAVENVKKIVILLEQQAMYETRGSVYWFNNFHDTNTPELQSGIMHGMAGIINFLLSVYEKGILPERSKEMATEALDFLLSHKAEQGINLFPFELLVNEQIHYQNLCYGDLGIGYVFIRAGKVLKSDKFITQGIRIIENAALFRDEENEYITDANLLYGAAGLYSFFRFINIDSPLINEAIEYWYNKLMSLNKYDTPWLGYKSTFNDHSVATQLCFSEGIAGIGITLMESELDNKHNYLSFLNYKNLHK